VLIVVLVVLVEFVLVVLVKLVVVEVVVLLKDDVVIVVVVFTVMLSATTTVTVSHQSKEKFVPVACNVNPRESEVVIMGVRLSKLLNLTRNLIWNPASESSGTGRTIPSLGGIMANFTR
jgi:hypothetical protein